MATTVTLPPEAVEDDDEQYVDAEEKGFLLDTPRSTTPPKDRTELSPRFWLSAGVNAAATAAIVGYYDPAVSAL